MTTPNAQLWTACLDGRPEQIRATINADPSVNMCAFLKQFHETAWRRDLELKCKLPSHRLPSEAAIAVALEAYRPHASQSKIGEMFRLLCSTMFTPDSLRTFLKLYAGKLTPIQASHGMHSSQYHLKGRDDFKCSEIVEACFGILDHRAYWLSFVISCHDQQLDLVEKLIGTYGYPIILDPSTSASKELDAGLLACCKNGSEAIAKSVINKYGEPACKSLLSACGKDRTFTMFEMVFNEYALLLTTAIIVAGFRSVCWSQDPEMIMMYMSHFEQFASIDGFTDTMQRCCADRLDLAVKLDHAGVVEVLSQCC